MNTGKQQKHAGHTDVSKGWNIPNLDLDSEVQRLVELNEGVPKKTLRKNLQKKWGESRVPNSTYYHRINTLKKRRILIERNGRLYLCGHVPREVLSWNIHNLIIRFMYKYEHGYLVRLCDFLNKSSLIKNQYRKAMVWPPNTIEGSHSIKIACGQNPLTSKEILVLRDLIHKFAGKKIRMRVAKVKGELNIDTELHENLKYQFSNITFTELKTKMGKIRAYIGKKKDRKVLRIEQTPFTVNSFEELIDCMVWIMDVQYYVGRLQKTNKAFEELQGKYVEAINDRNKCRRRCRELEAKLEIVESNNPKIRGLLQTWQGSGAETKKDRTGDQM
ncbi:MAG: hypothetical protein HXS48_13985 [Theionarchaea archaeon]|nr:MAG: hypothetical protein AYK19_15945 [Theionarchaea archaeon DG-70-1]MBU7028040.1 hypothetical protein [Theionarchaea archaeon]